MDNNTNTNINLIKIGNTIINESQIRWLKKIDECIEICVRANGCSIGNTHVICKINKPASYEKLNKYFETEISK